MSSEQGRRPAQVRVAVARPPLDDALRTRRVGAVESVEQRTHHIGRERVDEFGGTAGLLTLEDVLSQLLGEVGDEFKSGDPQAESLPDGRLRIPGGMAVDEAALLLNTTWETDAATVGGLVTASLGRLPAPGDRTTVGEYEFDVERVADRAVDSVLARRVVAEEAEAEK